MTKKFIDCWDYSTEELLDMVKLIRIMKKAAYEQEVPKLLDGMSLAMIFNGNSTRTRVSFETAAQQLGAHALYLTGGDHGELHLGKRETIKDTATVVASMVQGIAMRWYNTKELEEFAEYCTVPFFNMMDLMRHPTQTLCDLTTIIENLPEGKELKDVKLVFMGLSIAQESSANDLANLLPRFGATVVLTSPEGHFLGESFDKNEKWIIERDIEKRRRACEEGGGKIIETSNPYEAVKDADFIYSGCFCYEGMESAKDFEYFKNVFVKNGFQVNEDLLKIASTAKTMHYLPALRGKEMTDYAMDFEGSLLWKQAENRLHTQRGLLSYLMGPESLHFADPAKSETEEVIKALIKEMVNKYGFEPTHK